MSETVHYRGVLKEIKPTETESLEQIAEKLCKQRAIRMSSYNIKYHGSSWVFELCDVLYPDYVYIKNKLYEVHREDIDIYEDIVRAEKLPDGNISFELKYYNGGAGFNECLEAAINNIKKIEMIDKSRVTVGDTFTGDKEVYVKCLNHLLSKGYEITKAVHIGENKYEMEEECNKFSKMGCHDLHKVLIWVENGEFKTKAQVIGRVCND